MSIFDQICSAVGSDFVDGQTVNQQYQPPQQRTWVGLTNEERLKLYRKFEDCLESDGWEYEKAIEAELKEKNT